LSTFISDEYMNMNEYECCSAIHSIMDYVIARCLHPSCSSIVSEQLKIGLLSKFVNYPFILVFLEPWPVWMTNHPPSVLWHCWLGHQTCKNRRPYNLYCVGADVKPCSVNQPYDGFSCNAGFQYRWV